MPNKKTDAKNQHKCLQYRNLKSTLRKGSKQSHFTNSYQKNIKDLKNICKGIKNISRKSLNCTSPDAIIDNNTILTNSDAIANTFNKYFFTISLDIQSSIRYLKQQFLDLVHRIIINSFCLTRI